MKRRDFLKKGSLAVSAVSLAGITGISFKNLLAKTKKNSGNFSFEIITDMPGQAEKLMQELFRRNQFDDTVIKFSEYKLTGEMFGDIVFVNEGRLINYKKDENVNKNIITDIRKISVKLSLPKKLINPSRLRFYVSENDSPAQKFLVFHKDILIKTIKADNRNLSLNIEGTKGNVLLNMENKKARVVSSSCIHKTCVNSGSIAFNGESIVCIPNELFILAE